MKNPIKTYNFWLKIIGAALLIVLGVWLLVDNTTAKLVVLLFTGLVAGIFAIIRVIPLIRTLKTGRAKLVCFFEILIHLLLSVYLCYAAFNLKQDPESALAKFNDQYYRFFIAFFFYTRAVVYFMCAILFKEETDKTKFWIHIILITLACFLCAIDNLTTQAIAITIAVIAFLVSLGLIGEGASGYGRYRKMVVKERNANKEKKDQPKPEKEVPTREEIIPVEDPKDQPTVC